MKDLMTLKQQIERGEYRIAEYRIAEAIVARLAEEPNALVAAQAAPRRELLAILAA